MLSIRESFSWELLQMDRTYYNLPPLSNHFQGPGGFSSADFTKAEDVK
jgi:hypothetical protein